MKIQTNKLSVRTEPKLYFTHCLAGMIHIDCDNSEINSNADPRLGVNPNRRSCQPCDADAIDGEDSPLQSKRSSRFQINKWKSKLFFFFVSFAFIHAKINKQTKHVKCTHQIQSPFSLIFIFHLYCCCCFFCC